MQRLSFDVWETIFRNLEEDDQEVEVVWLDGIPKGEWGLCFDCEMFEDGFESEIEARERLWYVYREYLRREHR